MSLPGKGRRRPRAGDERMQAASGFLAPSCDHSVGPAAEAFILAKPYAQIRLHEDVDFVWRQRHAPQMKLGKGVEGVERESYPQLFICQQPVDDISYVVLRHRGPPSFLDPSMGKDRASSDATPRCVIREQTCVLVHDLGPARALTATNLRASTLARRLPPSRDEFKPDSIRSEAH